MSEVVNGPGWVHVEYPDGTGIRYPSEIATKLATGEIATSAPFDGMDKDWSESDKAELERALGKMFRWKRG